MRRIVVVAVGAVVGLGCGGRGQDHRDQRDERPLPPAVAPAPIEPGGDTILTDAQLTELVRTVRRDTWYSMYLQDRKAGWANIVLRPSAAGEPAGYVATMHMHAELGGPEGTTVIDITDETRYDAAPPFALLEKHVHEQTDSGVVDRRYRATADGLELTATTDGKAAPPRRLPPTRETVASPILSMAIPATVRAGQRTSYASFDDDRGLDKRQTLTVDRVAREVIAGVEVPVVTVSTLDDGDAIPVTVRIADGQALGVTIGAGVRIELADRADAQGPVERISMMDTSVPVDKKLGDTAARAELTLVVGAAPGFVFPSGPQQEVTPTADGRQRITLRRVPGPAVTAAERAAALAATPEFDADDATIVAQARAIVAGATTDRAKVERIVAWVYANLGKDLSTNLSTASQVLDRRRGDCTEHTLLVVGLARATGIPARQVSGLMYIDDAQRFFWHAWAQVELDGRWVAVDGAWGQALADVGHLAFDYGDGNGTAAMGSVTISAP